MLIEKTLLAFGHLLESVVKFVLFVFDLPHLSKQILKKKIKSKPCRIHLDQLQSGIGSYFLKALKMGMWVRKQGDKELLEFSSCVSVLKLQFPIIRKMKI